MKIESYSTPSVFDPYSIYSANNKNTSSDNNNVKNNTAGIIYSAENTAIITNNSFIEIGGWTLGDSSEGMSLNGNSLTNDVRSGLFYIAWTLSYICRNNSSTTSFGISVNNAEPDVSTIVSSASYSITSAGNTIIYLNAGDNISLKVKNSVNTSISTYHISLSAVAIN